MAEIGIKELKSGASRVIDEVSEGRSYVVTKRGRAAAVIVPLEETAIVHRSDLERWLRSR